MQVRLPSLLYSTVYVKGIVEELERVYLRENGSEDGCGTVMLQTDDMVLIELGV